MAHPATASMIQQLESLFEGRSIAGFTDRELIDRFTSSRGAEAETAFAGLSARHGPMVLGVCRQVLHDPHDAEDAFQAIFLVLARKARTIRDPEMTGSWIYGVSLRTARKLKTSLRRRRKHEEADAACVRGETGTIEPTLLPADESAIASEHAEILHTQIARLPRAFRLPVVVCYFEGLTLDEAARRLKCPGGTVASRLARARDRLRLALTRRGVASPSLVLAGGLAPQTVRPLVSFKLAELSTRGALSFVQIAATGETVSHGGQTLAREVLSSMMRHNLSRVAIAFLLLGTIVTGAAVLAGSSAMRGASTKAQGAQPPKVARDSRPTPKKAAAGRMLVTGRVLDSNGKPVPNATVMVHAASRQPARIVSIDGPHPIGQARNDESGRFQVDAARTTTARDQFVSAVAVAPRYGANWALLDPDADEPTADIILGPEQVIHGRIFDVQGEPARDVKATVQALFRIPRQTPGFRGEAEGQAFWMTRAEDLMDWPQPSTSDAEGRFTLRGIDRGTHIYLEINDIRFARQRIDIDTSAISDAKPLRLVLGPAKVIDGRITYADSGKPVANAWVTVQSISGGGGLVDVRADADGTFRAHVFPGNRFVVVAHAPDRQAYLSTEKSLDWPKAAIQQSVNLALPSGVPIRGRVTEEGSGKPVEGATVRYLVRSQADRTPGLSYRSPAVTNADGSFEFGVAAQTGHLVISAPTENFVLQEIDHRTLFDGGRDERNYGHAFVAVNPKPGNSLSDMHVVLRKGLTIKGSLAAPPGRAPGDTWIFSRLLPLGGVGLGWRWWAARIPGHARNGRFELHGLDPAGEYAVYFLEPKLKLGATAMISGKLAAGLPVTIRLEPCGAARARLLGPDGNPIATRLPPAFISMVLAPGPPPSNGQPTSGQLAAEQARLSEVDPVNHSGELVSDAQGRIEIPVLIPGATYRLSDRTGMRASRGEPVVLKEFQVKPTQIFELGDIRIEKPPPTRAR